MNPVFSSVYIKRGALAALSLAAACTQPVGETETSGPEGAQDGAIGVQASALEQDATLNASRDTYVRELALFSNFGNETPIRVQGLGRERSLVQFDQAALVAAAAGRPVVEAQLELTVQDVGWIWGQVSAHRMKTAWTELGATWACANDTNTGNLLNNCTTANSWQMAALLPSSLPYLSTASDTKDITNGTTVVRFNVTTDVKAFLGGSATNNGWLLKVAIEGVPGLVRFRARQATPPPRLILDLGPPACTPTASTDTTCDGKDDDCSGTADEDYVASAISCGVGACTANGTRTCVAGAVVNSCTPGTPAANDASCNGVDDDCSGATDEDYVSTLDACGVGACSRTAASSCVAGHVLNNCAPGTPASNDATCDGVDDDCSGAADEDFVSVFDVCGLGACLRTAANSCVGGHLLNNCVPGPAAADDAICNGVDENCNGFVDEDYVAQPTSCGQGVCQAAGLSRCVGGTVDPSCTEGAAAGPDTTCDGRDDDCDGHTDEAYASHATSCGQGVCAGTGTSSCNGGLEASNCTQGAPTGPDTTCDDADDDCDGHTDESYASHATSCGIGECARASTSICAGGSEQDNCTPGTPSPDDENCNGLDENCNGIADEFFVGAPQSCTVAACSGSAAESCVDGHTVLSSCTPVAGCEAACDDHADNDGDDATDCADSDCVAQPACLGQVGDDCTTAADCNGYSPSSCWTEASSGIPGGYCTNICHAQNECPSGSVCVLPFVRCMLPCNAGACPAGEVCGHDNGIDYCVPLCTSDADCTGGRVCNRNACTPPPPPSCPGGRC